tara:strand:+ start:3562 stop:5730 length:2169 start_codon:yes stop_codon:yes gene_type:complete
VTLSPFFKPFGVCIQIPFLNPPYFEQFHYICEPQDKAFMASFKRYTITAALPYANGPVHIGHLAGVYIPADIYARYLRSKGEDVLYVCGSDEHGVPITLRAKAEGIKPQDVVDKYHGIIEKAFSGLGISMDVYHRTSDRLHHETATDFFKKLYENGKLIEKESEQLYDAKEEQFLADRYVIGECPKCGNKEAYGDQCEKCGTSLSPKELINPVSKLSGEKPVMRSTKHWYLPLDQYETFLKEWILEGHKDWKSNVYGQCKSWIDQGLQPRAVTRDLDWGVKAPVPEDGKVMYVWFDAPIGYISATRQWAKDNNKAWEPYWQSEDTKLVHFIGKDNIVFHCVIFPAMIKAHGDYILPENVPANEFLNLENDKISTSRNWAVWAHEYLEDFPGKEDVLRYVLCANAPESKDNDFTWKDFQARNNNELVAILGNFVNRVIVLSHKYFNGLVPSDRKEKSESIDDELLAAIELYPEKISKAIEQYKFREGLQEFMNLARAGNKYLTDTEPWKIFKTDSERVERILHLCLQLIANLSIMAEPFMPFSSEKLKGMLALDIGLKWKDAGRTDLVKAGIQLQKAVHLFAKIEDGAIEAQIERLRATQNNKVDEKAVSKKQKPMIQFDDFTKLDLKIGTIAEAEKMPKADKLLILKVGMGEGAQRTIVSGIAEHYSPEEIIGKQVVVLTNLEPRKLRGVLSEGMVLMAEDDKGKLSFVSPESVMDSGSIVR